MAGSRHYTRAPITEAIIDIRADVDEDLSLELLGNLHVEIREAYPTKARRQLAHGHFEVGQRIAASATSTPVGFLFKSTDEKQVFQARPDGFTLSRLAPYESWEPFRSEAQRLWEMYRKASNRKAVTRVAVRYINRIDIPRPISEINDYLRVGPKVSADLQHPISGMFMQLTFPQTDISCTAILTEAFGNPTVPNNVSVILDIDLFRDRDVPQDDPGIWEMFEVLHERKNAIFEACITDKTRELFQ